MPKLPQPTHQVHRAGNPETGAGNRRRFSGAAILRWDSDTTKGKNAHQKILDTFRSHEADILIGTQMIAKGLDLPNVTLVGVVIADTV
jgi:primosomal protein N' (replication factor Y)